MGRLQFLLLDTRKKHRQAGAQPSLSLAFPAILNSD